MPHEDLIDILHGLCDASEVFDDGCDELSSAQKEAQRIFLKMMNDPQFSVSVSIEMNTSRCTPHH